MFAAFEGESHATPVIRPAGCGSHGACLFDILLRVALLDYDVVDQVPVFRSRMPSTYSLVGITYW